MDSIPGERTWDLGEQASNVAWMACVAAVLAAAALAIQVRVRHRALVEWNRSMRGVLLAAVLVASRWVGQIPLAALAGVLIATALRMVKVSSLRPLLRATRGDAVVLVLTAVATVAFDLVTAVNMKAIYHAARRVVPIMEKQGGGVILTTASTAGTRPRPGLTWFNASKGWAISATKSMAIDMYMNSMGIRAIGRVLGASPAAVLNWIRKEHAAVQRQLATIAPADVGAPDIIEMDEIYTYVQKNSSGQ